MFDIAPAKFVRPPTQPAPRRMHPVWPLPSLNGRDPVVIERGSKFPGLDLAYARPNETELIAKYPLGPNGTATHFMPDLLPTFCVGDGVITYAAKQSHAYALVVNHDNGWATYYANLEHMFAMPTTRRRARVERVKAGDVLGYVGSALPGEMKCLHFELWKLGDDSHFAPVESLHFMRSWHVLPWTDERMAPMAPAVLDNAA